MESELLALDGSVVTIRTEADVEPGPATTTAWAVPPSFARAHPFTAYPAGHSREIEAAVRREFRDLDVGGDEELSMKDGSLRVAEVSMPGSADGYAITVGAWEGRHGCLVTSLPERRSAELVEIFDSLEFRDEDRGLVIDSPIVARLRPPEVVNDVPGLGIVSVRPAIATELEGVPRESGARTRHGEVFRVRAESRALLFLGRGSIVRIEPGPDVDDERVADTVDGLDVDWQPRQARRRPR